MSVRLSISPPAGWTAVVPGATLASKTFREPVAPGASVSATFKIASPAGTAAGVLSGKVEWKASVTGRTQSETTTARVRNVLPVKINEVRFGTSGNATNQFIELYNASDNAVDLSNWVLVHTQSQWTPVRLATVAAGTKLARGAY